jgi:hypothetical protein
MPGRFAAESVADFKRNQWPIWRGISMSHKSDVTPSNINSSLFIAFKAFPG